MKLNKIYIFGAIGSGKSTLGKELGYSFDYNYFELDNVFFVKNNKKWEENTSENIQNNLQEIFKKNKVVIEDIGNLQKRDFLDKIDLFILLDPPILIRIFRIVKRFIKRSFNIEEFGHDLYMSKYERVKFHLNLIKHSIRYKKSENFLKLNEYIINKEKKLLFYEQKEIF